MRDQYAAEQNITIGSDGCFTEIDLHMYVAFTADVSEDAETVEITRLSFYEDKGGYRGEQVQMPDWVRDRYLSSLDLKEWLLSVADDVEVRAEAEAELARALS